MAKRTRGGQKGNTNALKHGRYSDAWSGLFGKEAKQVFDDAVAIGPRNISTEIAGFRTAMWRMAKKEPENLEVLAVAARTLCRMVAVNYGLTKDEQQELHTSFLDLIQEVRQEIAADDDD